MPITLPTTTTTTQDSASPPPPTSSPSTRGGDLSLSLSPSAHIKARILRPLDDLASTRGKLAAAVVVCRALYNLVHFVLAALSRRQHALLTVVYHVVDQLVVMYSVGVIVEAEGERRVLGWRVVSSSSSICSYLFLPAVSKRRELGWGSAGEVRWGG
ncbi:uncharacterized protein THITE_2118320 [Thermothielavioides terrestris NRRL 8126]|uniref:Uncharacterized protein n=1 Tax=Thermothielavioides terrestris (strain ATCC 38088 / NRRL 8126) TaxID=578455 RepID=G2R9N8_THETT|nr:uncharacterized protein THITE_2118320 [Thermothielavioides terrestris NRRL 8126]AEO68726.1 hypothetical protein THITE_2118320 [Thermothielavioides terrestris NRRL 8126]